MKEPVPQLNDWDSPYRTRRLEWGTNREIPLDEFNAHQWLDVTSMRDPQDCHVYIKGFDDRKPIDKL
jgi:hypothetical protein